MNNNRTLSLVLTSVFAALICVCTLMVQIPIPATGGYANPGDGVLLLAAGLLPLPLSAAAAAVGSMLADVITGYMLYAPATFIIKGSMALLCGFLLKKLQGKKTAYILSALAAECLMVLGYFLYEAIFLGLGFGAAAGIMGNAGQGALGAVIFCVLFPVIKKVIGKHL